MDAVLGAVLVLDAVVEEELLELVAVGERASGDVDVLLAVSVHTEHQ